MQTHVRVLGWLYVVMGILELLAALAIFAFFAGVGVLTGAAGDGGAGFLVGSTIGTVLGVLIAITALPELIVGGGLLGRRSWARWVAIILAFLNLLKFPYGTALGIYALWVLFNDETEALFRRP